MTRSDGRGQVWLLHALQTALLPVMLAVPAYLAAVRTMERSGTRLHWYLRVEIAGLSLVLGAMLAVLVWAGLVLVGWVVERIARLVRGARRR